MTPTWQTTDGSVKLYLGDCLDVLPTLEAGSVDAVVTDPPYIVGAVSIGTSNAKAGTWADMMNAGRWFESWFSESKRILRHDGFLATCGNWRSIPTLLFALSRLKWAATSCLIWDKQWIGPAYKNALRPTYEIVLMAAMPDAEILDRGVSDIFRGEKWLAGQCKTTEHPAEKPVDLMRHLVEHTTRRDGVICDPFMGSGTTIVAASQIGRRALGIEQDERNFEEAVKRIEAELNRAPLFDEAPAVVQAPLF